LDVLKTGVQKFCSFSVQRFKILSQVEII